jgi:putative ABC transport system permease protein
MISWGYALRELDRRRGRSLLSLLSVVIAVAAIVAVTSATATTRSAYQQVFEVLAGRADLEVVARGGGRFQESVGEAISEVSGLRAAVPAFHRSTIIYAKGKKAKVLAIGIVPDDEESLAGFELREGEFPSKSGQIALEAELADTLGIKVGDSLRLLTARGLRPHKLVALIAPENAVRLHQGGMLLAPLASLQRIFRNPGEVDGFHLYLENPKQLDQVREAVTSVVPPGLLVRVPSSRSGLAEEMMVLTEVSLDMASGLSFTTAVFIALSVFLMNVGERRRQLSILRAVGATRRQIVGMVCREALVMGVAGTAIGIPIGIYGGRFLIRSIAAMLQANLPETPDLRWAFAVGGILGPAICLLAAWYPARKAAQVSPLEGMRPVVTMQPQRGHRSTSALAFALLVASATLTTGCILGHVPVWWSIVAAILSLVALVFLLPIVLLPGVRLLAWPLRRVLAVEGEMSERMVLRHAGRTSLTVGVLLIAVAAGVGTSNAVFSITEDIHTWYERTITADYLLRAMMPDMSGQDAASMSESFRDEVAKVEGVDRIEGVRLLHIETGGHDAVIVARDFALYDRAPLDIIAGDPSKALEQLHSGEVIVGSVLAERLKVRPGDTLDVIFSEKNVSFRVAGVATEYSFGGSVVYADRGVIKRLFNVEGIDSFLIKATEPRVPDLEAKLRALADENGLLLQSFNELQRMIDSMVAGVTTGLWVMLILGLFVGALGVVNTLTMNVLEQTRELGMLRAIGMRRGQIIKTVMGQAAFVGLLGILLGGGAGVFMARTMNYCLGSIFGHYVTFALRAHLVGSLMGAGLAVVMLAALVPARRAANLALVSALRQE